MFKRIYLTTAITLALASTSSFALATEEGNVKIKDTVTSRTVTDVEAVAETDATADVEQLFPASYEVVKSGHSNDPLLPCPFGWSVQPNPSVDNSLSYVDADGQLSVSVTDLSTTAVANTTAEAYARVAAEQMDCKIPTRSNLIEDGWSFDCEKEKVEAIVYGDAGELALLAISGRNADTEAKLEEFIKFLALEARK